MASALRGDFMTWMQAPGALPSGETGCTEHSSSLHTRDQVPSACAEQEGDAGLSLGSLAPQAGAASWPCRCVPGPAVPGSTGLPPLLDSPSRVCTGESQKKACIDPRSYDLGCEHGFCRAPLYSVLETQSVFVF